MTGIAPLDKKRPRPQLWPGPSLTCPLRSDAALAHAAVAHERVGAGIIGPVALAAPGDVAVAGIGGRVRDGRPNQSADGKPCPRAPPGRGIVVAVAMVAVARPGITVARPVAVAVIGVAPAAVPPIGN